MRAKKQYAIIKFREVRWAHGTIAEVRVPCDSDGNYSLRDALNKYYKLPKYSKYSTFREGFCRAELAMHWDQFGRIRLCRYFPPGSASAGTSLLTQPIELISEATVK